MSIAIKRKFTIPSTSAIGATELYLTSSVASTTIGSGALQVAGGAGISGVISLGGELKLFNGSFYTGFDSAATANTTYIWPATSPSTGTSVLSSDAAGNLSWILMSASGSGLTLNGLTSTTQTFATGISGTDFVISSSGSSHTFNIPDASATARGLITTGTQTISGTKTFSSTITGSITGSAGSATTSTSSGTAGTAINAGSAGTSVTAGAAGTAINSGSAGSATTSTNAGFAGAATTATSAGTAGTATNAGSAGTSVTSGSAGTAVNAGSATTATNSGFAGAATTATSAGTAGTAANAGSAGTATNSANTNIVLDTTSTIFLTGSRSNVSIASTAVYVLSGVSALGNTITATTFSGNATTATSAGTAGTATNAGSAGSATTANSAGTAGTATNAGSAGSATTATSAGTAGTATNAGSAGTSVTAGSATTATNAGTAGTATNAGSAGTSISAGSAGTSISAGSAGTAVNAGSATTATSAGTAGTATNAGSAGTSTNSANTNVNLDTTSTIYLTGSRSNASIGNTPTYVLSGVSALGNTLSALGLNVTGSTASTSTLTGALIITGGVGIGGSLWTSTTNFSSVSGVGISNSVITSGVWSGTAISAVNGGTGLVSYTTGDILYASSLTTLARITAGTAGSVLTSAGAGSTPYWAVATAGAATGLTLNGLTTSTQFFATSIAGSGFTIGSTGSTHTYYIALAGNATTGLISGAAQTIFGLKTFASGLAITSGAVSTNTTTGALTVAGGVGITGQLSVNTIALGSTSVSVTPSMVFTGSAGTVISMSVLSDTTLAWEGSSGQLFSIDNNLSSGEIFSVSDISGLPIISASAGQSIYLNEFGGFTQVGNGLASTNTTTGALRVVGGVGITGSLYLGSPLLVPSGGTGITTYTTGDILHASSSTTLGRISAGTAGSILTSAGTGATPYWGAATGSTLAIAGTNNGDIQYKSASALGASSALNFDASTSTFKLTGFPIEAVSSSSANIKLLGGSVSWNGNINGTMLAINTANSYVGDLFNAQIGGTSRFKVSYTGAVSIGNSYTLPITDGNANQVLQTNGSGTVSWANSVISSAQYNIGYYASAGAALTGSSTFTNNTSTGVVSIGHTTASTGFSTGALVVTGGVGVGGTLNVGADLGISGLTTLTYTSEKLNTKTSAGSAGTVTHDLSTGSVFYHSSISNNFTANFTNVPTTNDRALGVTLILAQGGTAYMANLLQIDGTTQTVKWVNNSTPTGTANKVDIVGFSLIRTGSAWTVLGQYSTYG